MKQFPSCKGSLSPVQKQNPTEVSTSSPVKNRKDGPLKKCFQYNLFRVWEYSGETQLGRGTLMARSGGQPSLSPSQVPLLMVGVCTLCFRTQVQPGSLSLGSNFSKQKKSPKDIPVTESGKGGGWQGEGSLLQKHKIYLEFNSSWGQDCRKAHEEMVEKAILHLEVKGSLEEQICLTIRNGSNHSPS